MHRGNRDPVVARRTLLSTAAATVTTRLVTGPAAATAATAVPRVRVTPVWTEELRRTYGVAMLPVVSLSAYSFVDDWTQRVSDLGAAYVRGRYVPGATQTPLIVERLRALGLKWLMAVIPEDWSMS